jgi:hypothetical protein
MPNQQTVTSKRRTMPLVPMSHLTTSASGLGWGKRSVSQPALFVMR